MLRGNSGGTGSAAAEVTADFNTSDRPIRSDGRMKMEQTTLALGALVGLAVGIGLGFFARNRLASQELKVAHEKAARIVADARTQQKDLILEAKEEKIRLAREAEE